MSNLLEPVPETEAQGAVGDLYEALRAALGHLPNYGLTFGQRPELWMRGAYWPGLLYRTWTYADTSWPRWQQP